MDRHLWGLVLMAVVVAAEEGKLEKRGTPQAYSYSHVIHDHGHSTPHYSGDHQSTPHHDTVVQTLTKTVPYPVLQPYTVTIEKHIPVPVRVPVAVPVDRPFSVLVPKPYPVTVERPVPYTVERPYPYPVKYPVKVLVPTPVPVSVPKPYPVPVYIQPHHHSHDKSFSEQPVYEEESDYSGSAEEEDEHDR